MSKLLKLQHLLGSPGTLVGTRFPAPLLVSDSGGLGRIQKLSFLENSHGVEAPVPHLEHWSGGQVTSPFDLCWCCGWLRKGTFCYLIDVKLLQQVQVCPFLVQVPLGHSSDAQLLQAVHHVIESVLIWQSCQCLQEKTRRQPYLRGMSQDNKDLNSNNPQQGKTHDEFIQWGNLLRGSRVNSGLLPRAYIAAGAPANKWGLGTPVGELLHSLLG